MAQGLAGHWSVVGEQLYCASLVVVSSNIFPSVLLNYLSQPMSFTFFLPNSLLHPPERGVGRWLWSPKLSAAVTSQQKHT